MVVDTVVELAAFLKCGGTYDIVLVNLNSREVL